MMFFCHVYIQMSKKRDLVAPEVRKIQLHYWLYSFSIIHNNQDMETTKMFTKGWMDKEDVV